MHQSPHRGAVRCSRAAASCANASTHRKQWRRDHPFGFVAKPMPGANGVADVKRWTCSVPGKERTLWEGGLFKLELLFPEGRAVVKTPAAPG